MAMTARDHNNLLGIFFMVQGGLAAFVGLLLGLIYGGVGLGLLAGGHKQEDQFIGGVFVVLAIVLGILMLAFAGFELFVGSRIRKVAPIGRTLGIVVSILSLFSFPLGTALGIYGLWFFFGDMGKALYLGTGAAAGTYHPPAPPPPNSWA